MDDTVSLTSVCTCHISQYFSGGLLGFRKCTGVSARICFRHLLFSFFVFLLCWQVGLSPVGLTLPSGGFWSHWPLLVVCGRCHSSWYHWNLQFYWTGSSLYFLNLSFWRFRSQCRFLFPPMVQEKCMPQHMRYPPKDFLLYVFYFNLSCSLLTHAVWWICVPFYDRAVEPYNTTEK